MAQATGWRRSSLFPLIGPGALAFAGFFVTLAALPLWAVSNGASTAAAGLVTTSMLLATVLAQPLVPVAVARFGSRAVLTTGLLALGATPLHLLDARPPAVVAVSVVRGVGFAVVTVLFPLLITAAAPAERQGEAIGIHGLAVALPNLVAVPGGVALTAAGHFDVVGWLGALPWVAAVVVGRQPVPAGPTRAGGHPDRGRAAAVRATLGLNLVVLVTTLAGGALITYLPIARPTGALAPVVLAVYGAAVAVARWGSGVLGDRHPGRPLLPLGLLAAGLGPAVLGVALTAPAPSTVLCAAGAALFGIGFGAAQNLSLLTAFRRVGPAHRPTASAGWNIAFDAGTAAGAAVVGPLTRAVGFPGTLWLCAALVLLGAVAVRPARPTAGPDPVPPR